MLRKQTVSTKKKNTFAIRVIQIVRFILYRVKILVNFVDKSSLRSTYYFLFDQIIS